MIDKIYNSKELMIRYNISSSTLRKWMNQMGLPVFIVSDKKKHNLESDLKAWEESMEIQIPLYNND
jgi:hypothetical protein